MTRRRIAILGGGPSGLSAAFHLTSQPGWQERYEVTVYQMGWRLGGKCATGRDPDNLRIQEHGIHLFGGFYTNTFSLVRDAYEALYGAGGDELRTDEPIRTAHEAFVPNTFLLHTERRGARVLQHDLWPPDNEGDPWEPGAELTMAMFVSELLDALLTTVSGHHVGATVAEAGMLHRFARMPLVRLLSRRLQRFADALVAGEHDAEAVAARVARDVQRVVRLAVPLAQRCSWLRWPVMQLDLLGALARGVLDDRLLEGRLDEIDHETDREWLARHGASRLLLDSTLPQMVSNICFEYEDGDSTHGPRMSARAFASFQLRAMVARGRAMYYFRAGTGESIVTPLYRALAARGVRFEFFHKVAALRTAPDARTVDEIVVHRQATPIDPATGAPRPYQPTFLHAGLHCWPDRPDWSQLAEGEELQALDRAERAAGRDGLDLESWWCPWTGTEHTLRRGTDFDDVVLAIPVGALPFIATDVIERHATRWQPMLEHIRTTPTQHVQVWLDRPLSDLGWRRTERFGSATWQLPFTDVVDLTDLIPYEGWPADDRPGSVLYFCGPLQDDDEPAPFSDPSYPVRVRAEVAATAAAWLRGLHQLLPGVSGTRFDIDSFDYDLLHVPQNHGDVRGENRLRHQHIKANIDPNERYVLSLPGSNQYRLSAWGSGVDNLVLCGDWIDTGLNVGSFEAAVTSGMLASHALTGAPHLDDVVGYAFLRTPPAPPAPGPLWPSPSPGARGTKR